MRICKIDNEGGSGGNDGGERGRGGKEGDGGGEEMEVGFGGENDWGGGVWVCCCDLWKIEIRESNNTGGNNNPKTHTHSQIISQLTWIPTATLGGKASRSSKYILGTTITPPVAQSFMSMPARPSGIGSIMVL